MRLRIPKATEMLSAIAAGTPTHPKKNIMLASRTPQLPSAIGTMATRRAIGTRA